MTVKLHPIKSKVNSPLKITKLFQFQNSIFLTVFNCLLLQRLKFNIEILVVYALHDGQDLKHPLTLAKVQTLELVDILGEKKN